MILKNRQNTSYTWTKVIYIVMSEFLPTVGFKWLGLPKFNLGKNNDNRLRGCVLEVDL